MRLRDLQRRARLAALDLAEHRRRDAGALGQVAQREVHRLPQRLDARPDGRDGGIGGSRHYACTLSRTTRRRGPVVRPVPRRSVTAISTHAATRDPTIRDRSPDALVLGAGRDARRGVAARRAERARGGAGLDFRDCEYLLGTSAGSIVAATLAAGRAPRGRRARRPRVGARGACRTEIEPPEPRDARRARRRVARGAARAGRARDAARPAGAGGDRARRAARPRGGPAPGAAAGAHARRPRRAHRARSARASTAGCGSPPSTARSGRRVIFGAPDAPRATVAQAVLASCAVPWLFAPVEIGEREYVDGGVWSPTNLDAVPAGRGSRVLAPDPDGGRGAGAAADGERRRPRATSRWRCAPAARRCTTIVPDERQPRRDRPEPDGPEPARRGRRRGLRAGPTALRRLGELERLLVSAPRPP